YKRYFGEVTLVENRKDKMTTDKGAVLYNISYTSMTGFGFDVLNLDDLIDANDATKQQENFATAISFLDHTLASRANNILTAVIFNVQQRLAVNDPTGYFMEHRADEFDFVSIPSEFEEDTIYIMPCSGKIIVCDKGSYLWPKRF